MEKGRARIEWSTKCAHRASPWLKLGASSIALTAAMRSRFIRPAVHIQASITAVTARISAGKSPKNSSDADGMIMIQRYEIRDMRDQFSPSGAGARLVGIN